jgi:hypothetical protein
VVRVFNNQSELKSVKKIIKPIYSKEEYKEFYEEFPFSVSGSNTSAALIELGSNIALGLRTYERNIQTNKKRSNFFDCYF